ncbi:MAG: hypothetical protein OXF05_05395, partial [Hyphomicrobiales bacterium]|nr:hypothetical protein [Hyphomicrobiales bacterium]
EEADPESVVFELAELTGAAGWSLGNAIRHINITKEDDTIDVNSAFIWGDITTPPDIDAGDLVEILANENTVRFRNETSRVAENVNEGEDDEGEHNVVVETFMPGGAARSDAITLRVAASGGSATVTDDYTVVSMVTIAANDTMAEIPVTIVDDDIAGEINETIELVLTTQDGDLPEGWRLGSRSTHTVTITDDDEGIIQFAETSSTVEELDNGISIGKVNLDVSHMPAVPLLLTITGAGEGADARFGPGVNDDADADTTVSIHSGSIVAGMEMISIDVRVRADADAEIDEVIILEIPSGDGNGLSGSGFRPGTNRQHRITIPANDNTVSFAESTGTILEAGMTSFNIVFNINQPLPSGTNAQVVLTAVHNGGTMRGDDYTLAEASGNNGALVDNDDDTWTWTLPTGTGTAALAITAVDDDDNDDNETVTFMLADPTGVTGWAAGSGTLTIDIDDDDDPPPEGGTFTFRSGSTPPVELAEGGSRESFTVFFDKPIPSGEPDAVLRIAFAGLGTAPNAATLNDITFVVSGSRGVDYDATTGNLTIPSGATSPVLLTVTARSDGIAEVEEKFTLSAVANSPGNAVNTLPAGYSVTAASYEVVIPANENTFAFGTLSRSTIPEEEDATIPVTINMPIPAGATPPPTVTITPSTGSGDGDARIDTDYRLSVGGTPLNGNTWTLPTGSGTAELTIETLDTDDITIDREFTLTLEPTLPEGWAATPNARTYAVTIANNDKAKIGFSESASSVPEGTTSHSIGFDIMHTGSVGNFDITIVGTGLLAAADVSPSNPVTISGKNNQSWEINIPENNLVGDGDRIVTLRLVPGSSLPSDWEVLSGQDTHTLTITDNDTGTIGFTLSNVTAREHGEDRTYNIPIAVSGTPATSFPLTVNIDRGPNQTTARSGEVTDNDFTLPATVIIPASGQLGMLAVTILADDLAEPDETITLVIPSDRSVSKILDGFSLGTARKKITIPANDNRAMFGVAPGKVAENAENLTIRVTLTNDAPAPNGLDLRLAITGHPSFSSSTGEEASFADGSAQSTRDFTIGPRGNFSEIPIYFPPDQDTESDTVILTLTAQDPSSFPTTTWGDVPNVTHEIVIDEDFSGTIDFATGSSTALEPSNGTAQHTVNIRVDGSLPPTPFTLRVADTGSTATDPADYTVSPPLNNVSVSRSSIKTVNNSSVLELNFTIKSDGPEAEDETIELTLPQQDWPMAAPGWSLGTAKTHRITIPANGNTVGFARNQDSIAIESPTAGTDVDISINNPLPAGTNASVRVGVTNRGGAANSDYVITGTDYSNGILTLPVSPSGTATLTVRATSDSDNETGENIRLTLTENNNSFPDGWEIGTDQHRVLFEDPPSKSSIGFTMQEMEVDEGDSVELVVLVRDDDGLPVSSVPADIPVSLAITDPDGDTDFQPNNPVLISSTATFTNGEVEIASFNVNQDELPENEEQITLVLSEGASFPSDDWDINPSANRLTVTISPNDNFIGFVDTADRPLPTRVQEGGTINLPVLLDAYDKQEFTLTATATGRDYRGNSFDPVGDISYGSNGSTIGFTLTGQNDADSDSTNGHQHTQPFEITADNDTTTIGPENAEEITVTLSLPSGDSLPAGFESNFRHTFTIPAHGNTVTFATGNPASFDEGEAGKTVNLSLSNPLPRDFPVTITPSGGDAGDISIASVTGSRYSNGVLTILQHATAASFAVTANEDDDTIDEEITLTLTGPVAPNEVAGWEIPANETYKFRLNDDDTPKVSTIGFVADRILVPESPPPPEKEGETAPTNRFLSLAVAVNGPDGNPVKNDDLSALAVEIPVTLTSTDTDRDDIRIEDSLDIRRQVSRYAEANDDVQGRAEIEVLVVEDSITEGAEVFTLTMAPDRGFPQELEIAKGGESIEIVILPSDNIIGFAEASETIYEDAGTHGVKVTLALPAPSDFRQDGILVSLTSSDTDIIDSTRGQSYEIEADDE